MALEHCKGCAELKLKQEGDPASCTNQNKDSSCICANCIIKMICENGCQEFDDWYVEKLDNYLKGP